MQDCKRIPYEPSLDEKFYIAEITGTKLEKNDARFYKVRLEQTWIPANKLRTWQDLIIQFWEGYHSTNDSKLEADCDQSPPVYVLTSDGDNREDIQVDSSSAETLHVVENDRESPLTYPGEDDPDYQEESRYDNDNENLHNEVRRNNVRNNDTRYHDTQYDDIGLDNDKISILGHKHKNRFKIRPMRGPIAYLKNDINEHVRPETLPLERGDPHAIPIKDEPLYGYSLTERVHPYLPTTDKTLHSGEPYNPYRLPLSPSSTREHHELQNVPHPVPPPPRNSMSPQEQMVSYELAHQKKAYYCYLCGKEYRSGTGLKQHLLAHKNEKPFGCTLCHRRYRWKGDLNRHMYTHLPNDELPLKCPECQKGFVRKDKMQLHINFAHGGSNSATTTKITTTTTKTESMNNEILPLPSLAIAESTEERTV